LVKSHREPAAPGTDEVDFHHDGHGPRESLARAEERVGPHDPAPRRRPYDEDGDGCAKQPAGDEHALAAKAIAEPSGYDVRDRLDDAERRDEGEHGGRRAESKLPLAKQGQDGALEADHRADKRVDEDEQPE